MVWSQRLFFGTLDGGKSARSTATENREFAFVHYFYGVGSIDISTHRVDKALRCRSLLWVCENYEESLVPGKYLSMCPFGSLRRKDFVADVSRVLQRLNGKAKDFTQVEVLHEKE